MKQLAYFPYHQVLVLGLAKSGTAAANVLLENNIHVRVNDAGATKKDPSVQQLIDKGAEVIVGSHPISVLDGIEVIIKNPGIPYHNRILIEAAARGIPVITEIELAANLARNHRMIGITGSNGKTTTTTLVEQMLTCSHQPVKLAGNIGVVATNVAQTLEKNEALLLELSSFQLMGIESFKPYVAALLNIHGAHLDYHGSLDNYIAAKANICRNQTSDDYFVYNADDEVVEQVAKGSEAQLIPFSIHQRHLAGAWVDETDIYFKKEKIISKKDVLLVGEHNMENILAAVSIAMIMGATVAGIQQVLQTFSGVKHRLQFVKTINGRSFYNDSKATNMLATEKALQAFTEPTILLAGGLDRGDTFEQLIPFLNHVKTMIVFGETKQKLKQIADEQKIACKMVNDVIEATKIAYEYSNEGDVILLSPACASWDQYKTFEERGDMFIHSVHKLV